MVPIINMELVVDTRKSCEILGIKYTPMEKAIIEMVYSMFETGVLEDVRTGKPVQQSDANVKPALAATAAVLGAYYYTKSKRAKL